MVRDAWSSLVTLGVVRFGYLPNRERYLTTETASRGDALPRGNGRHGRPSHGRIMATSKTTASDLVLEPTEGQFTKLVEALREHEGRNWSLGDVLNLRIPRGIGTFTSRDNGADTFSENELFSRLSDAIDGAIDTATMKRLRNTSAAYRSEDRTEGIAWSAHRAGEALAWRDKCGHRANLVAWFRSEHRTVTETTEHVATMMAKLDGTVVTKTKGKGKDGGAPNGHANEASATITGDDALAILIDVATRYDGSEPTEPKALVRAMENLMVKFNIVSTTTETVSV